MLHPEFIKDMQNSYLLLKSMEGSTLGYGSKMLVYNKIPGLLPVEVRCFDELNVYYYDISNKKNLLDYYDKTPLIFENIYHIITCVINILEGSLEYLLYENDFIIEPGYVYLDPNTNQIFLCHLVGYQVNVQNQISSFIEYLMNKVDYKDEKAVLLVYSLYKESRESNCTYEKLISVLNKKVSQDKEIRIENKEQREGIPIPYNSIQEVVIKEEKSNSESMLKNERYNKGNVIKKVSRKEGKGKKEGQSEKEGTIKTTTDLSYKHLRPESVGEEETMCYSNKTYLLAFLTVILGGILFIIALIVGLLHNTFKTQLDPVKIICFLIILGSIEVYLLCKLFQDCNKITKIISSVKYDDNIQCNNIKNNEGNNLFLKRDKDEYFVYDKGVRDIDLGDNDMTVNLNEDNEKEVRSDATEALVYFKPKLLLKPLDKDNYKYINLSRFPFLVGKNQKVVNHCLNSNTISRIHSRFEKSGDEIYLVDMNSLNGTFINGDRLDRNEPYKISSGDKISFAHLNYIFQVE